MFAVSTVCRGGSLAVQGRMPCEVDPWGVKMPGLPLLTNKCIFQGAFYAALFENCHSLSPKCARGDLGPKVTFFRVVNCAQFVQLKKAPICWQFYFHKLHHTAHVVASVTSLTTYNKKNNSYRFVFPNQVECTATHKKFINKLFYKRKWECTRSK